VRRTQGVGALWAGIAVVGLCISVAALGLSVPAAQVAAAAPAARTASVVRPNVTKPSLLVQGGALKCGPVTTTHGAPVITPVFTLNMATGTSGSQIVNPTTKELPATTPPTTIPSGSRCEITGVIPSGWSITVEGFLLSLSGAGNAGTLAAAAWHDTFTQTCFGTEITATTFTNQGTFTSTPGTHCAAGNVTANIATFTNTGTVTGVTKGGWIFSHHSTTVNGTFTNFGALAVLSGSTISFGGGGNACKFGTTVVFETGGTVDNQGTVNVDCGGLTVNGGTITNGPTAGSVTMSPVPAGESLRFGATPPAHAEGTIKLSGSGTTLTGTILSGYTVDQPNGNLPFTGSAGNEGTLILGGFSALSGPGTFTNAGTITVGNSYTISTPTFLNKGTIDVGAHDSLAFSYDSTTTPGAVDNTGTITVTATGSVTMGARSCKNGETLVLGKGSTVKSAGTFDIQCGGLTLAGGSVSTAGPVNVSPIGKVTVTFTKNTGTGTGGSTDTISVTSTGTTLVGLVPKGWTLESDVTVTALTKAGNEAGNQGVFDLTSGGKLVDSQDFYNYGTFETSASVTVTAHDFFSSGTVSALANSDLQFITDGGTVTARGPIDVAAKGAITVGSEGCTNGVTLVLTTGSSLSNSGTFDLQCGSVQLSGGTISSSGPLTVNPISKATVDFTAKAASGTGGTADTISIIRSGATVEGTIPTGWTVKADVAVTAAAGTQNDGTVVLLSGGSITDAGSLSNAGTLETDASVKVIAPTFTNSANGSVVALNGADLQFSYDNATTAGTVTNNGSMTVGAGGKIAIGPSSCKKGETLVTKAGSTIAPTGTFVMQCGELTVRGGTVTAAGPIELTRISVMSVHFATGLPTGAGGAEDTLNTTASGVVFDNSIPPGWTVNDSVGRTLTFSPGAANNGTLTVGGFGHLNDTSGFVNAGTMTVNGPFSMTKTVPTFTNTGSLTLDTRQGLTGRETIFDNTGTLTIDPGATLEFDGFSQTAKGTLNIAMHGTSFGRVYSDAGVTLNGTLSLSTTTVAAVGSRFNIVHWSTTPEKGNFAKINGDVISSTRAYGVQYCTGSVTTFCVDGLQLRVVNSVVAESLKASNVSTPTPKSVNPGKTFTVSYKVTNTGESTDPGGWEDSLYVGTGTTYQSGDTLLARIPHATTLDPGVSYTNTITVKAPNVSPSSNYHVIVVPDSAGEVVGATFGNQAASSAFTIGSIVQLKPGTPVSATVSAGENLYFRVTVSTADVAAKLTTPNGGVADLYAAHGQVPTASTFETASSLGAATPSVTLTKSTGGTWFLLVHGDDAAGSGVHVTIEATALGMTISSVSPSTIASSKFPGSDATLTVRGSGFTGSSSIALDLDGSTFHPTTFDYEVVNSTLAYVSVTTRMEQGAYTVLVTTGSSSATLPGAVTVTAPHTGGGLKITVSGGSGLRFGWAGSVTATFTNTSSADIDVPIVTFSATNGLVALPGTTTFQPDITVMIPNFSSPRGPDYPPGVLPPGATGSLSFAVLSTTRTTGGRIIAQVNDINSTERTFVKWTTLITGFEGQGSFGFACPAFTRIHTPGCTDKTLIATDIQFALGGTDGELARNVPSMLATAKSHGVTITNESQLFNYVIVQQIDSGSGAPVAGNLYLTGGAPVGQAVVDLTSTKSGKLYTGESWFNGQFSVWTVPPGTYTLTVPGYIPRPALKHVHVDTAFEVQQNHGTPSQSLSVSLHAGGTVKGTIVNATTALPVAGAVVTVADGEGSTTSGVTTTNGAYTVKGVVPGTISVTAQAPGFISSTAVTMTVSTGSTKTQKFSLSQGGTISGTVKGPGGSAAPTGVMVTAARTTGGGTGSGTVTLGGAFTVSGLPAGTYTVFAQSPTGLVAEVTSLAVTVGATTSAGALTLVVGGTVQGTVTSGVTDAPISGAIVEVVGGPSQGQAVTGANGSYTLTGVLPGTRTVSFSPPGGTKLNPTQKNESVSGGTITTLDVTLTPFGSISVAVRSTTGTAVGTATVDVTGAFGPSTGPGAVATRQVTTDSAGNAMAATVPDGTYVVSVLGSTASQTVKVAPGSDTPTATLTVDEATIAGEVLTFDGTPVSGVTVQVITGGEVIATATTTANGSYTLQVTAARTWTLEAVGPTFPTQVATNVSTTIGSRTFATFTGGTAKVAVTVKSGGTSLGTATVDFTPQGAPFPAPVLTTPATGKVTLSNVAPGLYTIEAQSSGKATTFKTVTVEPTSTATVTLTLATGGSISGTVGVGGTPTTGMILRAVDGTHVGATTSGATGHYTITDLAAGTYTVSVTSGIAGHGAPTIIGNVVVASASTASTTNATLSPTGQTVTLHEAAASWGGYPEVDVRVLDATGSQIARATLGPAAGASSSTTTATLGPLASGPYTLDEAGPGLLQTTQTITVQTALTLVISPPTPVATTGQPATELTVAPAVSGPALAAPRDLAAPKPDVRNGKVTTSHKVATHVRKAAKQRPSRAHRASHSDSTLSSKTSAHVGSPQTTVKPNTSTPTPPGVSTFLTALFNRLTKPAPTPTDNTTLQSRYLADYGRTVPACAGANTIIRLQNNLRTAWFNKINAYDGWSSLYYAFQSVKYSDYILLVAQILTLLKSIISITTTAAGEIKALGTMTNNLGITVAGKLTKVQTAWSTFWSALTTTTTEAGLIGGILVTPTTPKTTASKKWTNFFFQAGVFYNYLALIFSNYSTFSAVTSLAGTLMELVSEIKTFVTELENTGSDLTNAVQPILRAQAFYKKSIHNVTLAMRAVEDAFDNLKMQKNCPKTTKPKKTPHIPPTTQTPGFANNSGFDPNGLTGPPGFSTPKWVAPTAPLSYVVHFQNEPTASIAVSQVKVVEPLPTKVEPTSVTLTGFGFGVGTVHVVLPGGQQSFTKTIPHGAPNGDDVQVTGTYDSESNTITWVFTAINPKTGDADSAVTAGFLPPDTASGKGEGYVSFSAKMKPGTTTATSLTTKATVFFDRNPAIATTTWTNTVDANTPTAAVTPLPASSKAGTLTVKWNGSDGNGSGVASYDVYVSVTGGTLTPWQINTPANSAAYKTTAGHTYGFVAQATNNVGAAGTTPTTVQTTTTATAATTPTTPGKPGKPSATAGNASAKVSWTAPSTDGGSTITGYTVTSTPTAKTCSTTGARTCTVSGLTNGRAYTFTVKAKNAVGTGLASTTSSPVTPATTPGKPGKPSATAGNASAKVSWTAPSTDGGSTITGYTVTSTPTAKTCSTTGARTCTVSGLTNGRAYTFTVKAKNAVGTGLASVPSAAVIPSGPPLPTITSLSRTAGPYTGGNAVTITGTRFVTVEHVKFGTATATFTVKSATSIQVISPAHAAGTVRVSVVTAVGTTPTTSADLFTFTVPVPTVSGLSPASGSPSGGTAVTISGSWLSAATTVYFGLTADRTISVNPGGTQLTVRSPAGATGASVNVRVMTPGGESAAVTADLFTYGPTITSLSRTSGPVTGGTKVTITGTGLSTAEHVKFGTATATFTVKSATSIQVTSPAHAAGTVRVSVVTAIGTTPTTADDMYHYSN